MSVETAEITEQEPDLDGASQWGKLSLEEKAADAQALVEKAAAKREGKAAANQDIADDDTPIPPTKTPARGDETPAADDAAPAKATDEGEAETDWRNQEVKDLAAAYDIDEETLAAMPSRDVLDIAFRAIDRKAFEAGKSASKAPEAKTPEAAPGKSDAPKPPVTVFDDLTNFALDEELGADDAPKIQKAIAAAAAELKELREWRSQMQQQQARQSFEQIRRDALTSLHSLGFTDLYGEAGKAPTKEQAKHIEEALDGHFTHARGLLAQGRQAAPTPAFLKAAVQLVHGELLIQSTKQQQLDRLRKQSARRTGGSTSKTLPPDLSKMTPRERALRDPEIAKAFAKGQVGDE
jgi:hypothetical protein